MKKRLLLFILIIILIGVNSCKKESKASYSEVIMPAIVSSAEILAWFDKTPQVKPAAILLSEAEQQTINGKQVVRIPIATNAALYFIKQNDSLKVYAYKWIYNAPYTDKYTGKIDIYNFQDQTFKQQVYKNGVLNHIIMLRKRPAISVSSSLQTFDIWSGLAEIWCYITGGVWKESDPDSSGSADGEVRKPGCDYSASSDALGSNPPALPDDIYADDSGDVYTTAGDGSGGGVGWGPPPCPPGSVTVNSANTNHVNNMPLPTGCPTAPDGSQWQPYSVDYINSAVNIFGDLDNPVNVPDDPIIDMGIGVTDISPDAPLQGARIIARTVDRRPVPPAVSEDMTFGFNGNVTGINQSEVGLSDDELFDKMTSLFHKCTFLDQSYLQVVGDKMIQRFRSNTGGIFSDLVLDNHVQASSEYKSFIQRVGSNINAALMKVNGDINAVNTLNLSYRPIFNGAYNKFHGLQILIDDTEYTEVQISNYTTVNGYWSATLDVTIHDYFGLDRNDVLTFQSYFGINTGFADWWLLQHTRGYHPFETVVHLRQIVTGQYYQ